MPTLPIATLLAAALAACWATCAQADDWPPAPPLKAPEAEPAGELPASIVAEPTDARIWKVTFRFRPPRAAQRVSLAGSFNGWNPAANPMQDEDRDGVYEATVTLGAGDYQYKFVLDGNQWLPDPLNPRKAPDNFGGFNSVLDLGRLASLRKTPARRHDGRILADGLLHEPKLPRDFQVLALDRVLVRYRTYTDDVEQVAVAVRGDGQTVMHPVLRGPVVTFWEAELRLAGAGEGRRLEYTFVLTDGPTRVSDPHSYQQAITSDRIFRTPDWARDAVWYQIMPDRFRNGDPSNDPEPVRPWTSEWFTPSPWEGKDGQTFYRWYVFSRYYGGDIKGLEESLPYLKQLGVNAIYLNPIFKADSYHKYNATSWIHVDDHFGVKGDYDKVAPTEDLLNPKTWKWTPSDRMFLDFIKKAHAMGFRVIIDGVFNHVGTNHPAFQDVLRNKQKSRYADWFDVVSWEPFRYRGWGGFDALPQFRKAPDGLASKTLEKHIFDVTRRWMDPDGDGDPSDGIDGWRLDVPNEIPAPFWERWRRHVKAINPDAYISGEIWDRADLWLDGRHFDAVMNYEFARAAFNWIMRQDKPWKASQIDRHLAELRLAYPAAASYVCQNLLDSHDTDRIASMALNPNRPYDRGNRVQDDAPDYNNHRPGPKEYQKVRLAVLLQMTYVGAPMIYYGDEVGMFGADDPTNRKPMLWKDLEPYDKPEENFVDTQMLEYYRRVIALRNQHSALRRGEFATLLVDDQRNVWAFKRFDDKETLVIILNASDQPQNITLKTAEVGKGRWRVLFGEDATLRRDDAGWHLRVPGLSGVVLGAGQ